ncbi:alpha/beta-hydrolase [Calocera viscosa TUFC12733]|uniref:Carboxylic ester hydrolase n=1 Tax=Calocera viscosa (strain TUFC12733) TaxID=1330018 RepID=A0A167QKS1_CALVF|nr:alpha/beta-hydrolase [Calocera viscosa TUFC12733]
MTMTTRYVFSAAMLAFVPLVTAWGGPLLTLPYATYEGIYNTTTGVNSYYGIRYAQPPVGALRWQPPQDIELNNDYASESPIYAGTYAPECTQGVPYWAGNYTLPPAGSEDCLLLNIQVPANPAHATLPILLQIHGGGYTEGNPEGTPGDSLIMQSKGNIIYVAIQYRLSAYGFMSSYEIRQNGLLDQRAAIQWTQRYARYFGGDPSQITLIGGSAGGGSVMSQLILYGGVANPPFRAAISEYPWWQPFKNDSTLETQYRQLLNAAGCTDVACLRAMDETSLAIATQQVYVDAYAAGSYAYGDFYFGPSVDGQIIADLPSNEFKQGHFAKVPLLVNRDGYEGVIFSNRSITTQEEELADLQKLFPYAGPSFINRLYELYPMSAYNSTFYHRSQWFGDFIIDCPAYYMASAVADAGLPAYKLLFYAGTELHAATGPYLYLNNNDGTPAGNDTLGLIMRDWYLSFATCLNPNEVSFSETPKPYWSAYNDGSGFLAMSVNYTQMGVVTDFDASAQCDFFHAQSYVVRN